MGKTNKFNPLAEFQVNGLTGKFAELFKFPVILALT